MSYKGLMNLFTKFYDNGVPAVFDKSYFGNQSGSLTAQIRTTLRILNLIDEKYAPTPLLHSIVKDGPDARKTRFLEIANQEFSDVLSLGQSATAGQLAGVFKNRGLSGATVDKAISFYLGMASDLGIAISPHFKKGRSAVASSANGARRRKRQNQTSEEQPPPDPPPLHPASTTKESQRAAYVEMLMKLASSQESQISEGLLDRIERVLELGSTEEKKDKKM